MKIKYKNSLRLFVASSFKTNWSLTSIATPHTKEPECLGYKQTFYCYNIEILIGRK